MTRKAPPPPPGKKAMVQRKKGRWVPDKITTVDDDLNETDIPVMRFDGTYPEIYSDEEAKRLGVRVDGVPIVDPHYVFRTAHLRELSWAMWPHDGGAPSPTLASGPKGCGKTSLFWQVAAKCNIRVRRMNLNVGTTTRQLKGKTGARDGSTVFIPGVAVQAMEEGDWLLLDEISGATPPVALSLFPILEFDPPGAVQLENAEPPRYALRHPDFRIVATDNTIGAEQEDTRFNYGGTNPEVNEAFLDRFHSFIQCDYLSRDQEFEAVHAMVPGCDETVLEGMIRVATNVRASAEISSGFSTRMVKAWARRYAAGKNQYGKPPMDHKYTEVLDLAHPAFLSKMRSRIERDAIVEVIRRIYKLKGGGS